ncbi:MAG: hypothetical protein A2Y40_10585 [Candidatus Margulisbacteria bacterium GWF2_35_9]|nr:MAG: hypothetical protein A2Y40_10585 [Candidatus Margulisbacteria bacterium GWF2_35_9]
MESTDFQKTQEVQKQILELKELLVVVKPKIKILIDKAKKGETLSFEQKEFLKKFQRTIKLLKTSKEKNLF